MGGNVLAGCALEGSRSWDCGTCCAFRTGNDEVTGTAEPLAGKLENFELELDDWLGERAEDGVEGRARVTDVC